MPDQVKVGAIASNGKEYVQWYGSAWRRVAAPPAKSVKLTNPEKAALAKYAEGSQQGQIVLRDYEEAEKAIKVLDTGPWRGLLLDAAIPEEGGGILDSIGAVLLGAPARLTGLLSSGDVDNYTTLKRVQNSRVLAQQALQKGVQTEGDAARIKAGDISPRASVTANAATTQRGRLESQLLIDRAAFMGKWANRYGVYGVNEKNQTAEEAFQELAITRRKMADPGGARIEEVK